MARLIWAVSEDLTQDDFLGGKIKVWQPRRGYRAGVDPVVLAA
ncbi:MAG: methyltransferase, partial [Pseudomonadota bacterium]